LLLARDRGVHQPEGRTSVYWDYRDTRNVTSVWTDAEFKLEET
jgi:hypothetical protein